ncbi:MAG TPA: hypothetical protein VI248_06235, partial [Kineosporiaceae bacterium]
MHSCFDAPTGLSPAPTRHQELALLETTPPHDRATEHSVFADPDAATHQVLYGNPARLARRTRALHAAKVTGADAATTLTDLAARVTPPGGRIADIGCGRGTTSVHL